MQEPGGILEFLQTFRNSYPKLAARAFVNPANGILWRRDWINGVPIQFADKWLREMPYKDAPGLHGADGNAGGFRQAVGEIIPAPGRRFLAPTCGAQREGGQKNANSFMSRVRNEK